MDQYHFMSSVRIQNDCVTAAVTSYFENTGCKKTLLLQRHTTLISYESNVIKKKAEKRHIPVEEKKSFLRTTTLFLILRGKVRYETESNESGFSSLGVMKQVFQRTSSLRMDSNQSSEIMAPNRTGRLKNDKETCLKNKKEEAGERGRRKEGSESFGKPEKVFTPRNFLFDSPKKLN
ncbi:hypothetical protein RUM44_006467 [Polyplax serrata]|uniref:Uncharacterized protein n=1 Tax=Polyplax serrata TaxID=468196 RepID=A0ABR1AJQ4_POLSC